MNTPYCVITDAGREIMRGVNVSGTTAKSDPFTFTKIMLGCGTYTAEQKTESALRVMTALRTPKNNYPISSVKRVNASNNLYKLLLVFPALLSCCSYGICFLFRFCSSIKVRLRSFTSAIPLANLTSNSCAFNRFLFSSYFFSHPKGIITDLVFN